MAAPLIVDPVTAALAQSLRGLCAPGAEALSDGARIDAFVKLGSEAADRLDQFANLAGLLALALGDAAHSAKTLLAYNEALIATENARVLEARKKLS